MMYQKTSQLLIELQTELQQIDFWQEIPPSVQALQSTAPFCCDTMPLHQWLQFIFLPKMQRLIVSKQQLPTKIAIAPFAQVAYAKDAAKVGNLISILSAIDLLLSSPHSNELVK